MVVGAGDVIAGKYRVERILGRGGMGYVVAATHLKLPQRVAIKILRPELCEDDHEVHRFLREARASVRIQSEHVARVLDVGALDDGGPYIVIEFLEGHDLAHELRLQKQLPVADAVDYLLQACEAVAEAHALGIVHRDLKPANLFRTRSSDDSHLIKVLDFGISKALEHPQERAVAKTTQGLIGSPSYMSPEQAQRPTTVDARSDIWSLGIILYELLTSVPPFMGSTPLSVLAAVASAPVPKIRLFRADVPEGLESVILKCLEKERDDRFADVVELAAALGPFSSSGTAPISRLQAIVRLAKQRAGDPLPRPLPGEESTLREFVRTTHSGATLASPGLVPDPEARATSQPRSYQILSKLTASPAIAALSRRRILVASALVAGSVLILYEAGMFRGTRPDAIGARATHADGASADASAGAPSTEAALGAIDKGPLVGQSGNMDTGHDARAPAPPAREPGSRTSGGGGAGTPAFVLANEKGPAPTKPMTTQPPPAASGSAVGQPVPLEPDPLEGRK